MEKGIKILQKLQKQLLDTKLQDRVGKACAAALELEIERQYRKGVDPYNEAWAELAPATKAKGRTPPPLTATGEMKKNSKVQAISGFKGLRIKIEKPSKPDVPQFHQSGTENMPERKLVPDGGKLPKTWEMVIVIAASKVVIKHFKV